MPGDRIVDRIGVAWEGKLSMIQKAWFVLPYPTAEEYTGRLKDRTRLIDGKRVERQVALLMKMTERRACPRGRQQNLLP